VGRLRELESLPSSPNDEDTLASLRDSVVAGVELLPDDRKTELLELRQQCYEIGARSALAKAGNVLDDEGLGLNLPQDPEELRESIAGVLSATPQPPCRERLARRPACDDGDLALEPTKADLMDVGPDDICCAV
jgi:hypothetical protein